MIFSSGFNMEAAIAHGNATPVFAFRYLLGTCSVHKHGSGETSKWRAIRYHMSLSCHLGWYVSTYEWHPAGVINDFLFLVFSLSLNSSCNSVTRSTFFCIMKVERCRGLDVALFQIYCPQAQASVHRNGQYLPACHPHGWFDAAAVSNSNASDRIRLIKANS